MKRFIVFFICSICLVSTIHGQTIELSNYLPVPLLADAASVQRHTNYPVDYSTGIPNITIPLYEIKVGDISLPITLSYHSSGLKPNESSGRIAVGWTLNAEPSISKQTRGLDDWGRNGFPNQNIQDARIYGEALYYKKIVDGEIDPMPDIYYYQLGDESGSYTIASSMGSYGTYTPQPHNDHSISGTPGNMNIVDSKGILYKFGGNREFFDEYLYDGAPYRLLCREITSRKTKAKISFQYEDGTGGMKDYHSATYSLTDVVVLEDGEYFQTMVIPSVITTIIDGYPQQYTPRYPPEDSTWVSTNSFERYYTPHIASRPGGDHKIRALKKIEFDNGTITFEGSHRNTIDIIVKNKKNTLIKKITLFCSLYNEYGIDKTAGLIKLDSLNIYTHEGDQQKYTFSYYDALAVPSRATKGVDHWGFYNGEYGSSVPPLIIEEEAAIYHHRGNSRTSNAATTRVGALRQIVDPHGLETIFEYEGNMTGIQAFNYYYNKIVPPEELPKNCWIQNDLSCCVPQLNYNVPIGGLRIRRITETDNETKYQIRRDFRYAIQTTHWGEDYYIEGWGVAKRIPSLNDYLKENKFISKSWAGEIKRDIKTWYSNAIPSITFNGGTPIMYGRVTESKWDTSGANTLTEYYYDVPKLNTFEHYLTTDCDRDGGSVDCVPSEIFIEYKENWQYASPGFINFEDNKKGKLIKKLEYIQTEKGKRLVRKNEYDYNVDSYHSIWSEYVAKGFIYIENDYQLNAIEQAERESNHREDNIFEPACITNSVQLVKDVCTEYTELGDPIVKTTEYDYNGVKLHKERLDLGNGKQKEECYTYVDDFGFNLIYPENIIFPAFKHDAPKDFLVEHKTIIGRDTTYFRQAIKKQNNLFQVTSVVTKSELGPKFYKLLDIKYDSYGNIIETTSIDGTHTSYIWSYNNQSLIAEVKNISFDNLLKELGSKNMSWIDNLGRKTRPTSGDYSEINSLRRLSELSLTTYTYTPLVGMTSITDASGKTTYFDYDKSNRLKRTFFKEKDTQGNSIDRYIKSFQYNFGVNGISKRR